MGIFARVLIFIAVALAFGPPVSGQKLTFNRDIRPILADNCFPCHGPDSAARQADLRLDKRDSAIEIGAIEPGDTESSELVRRINSDDDGEKMPPAESNKQLNADQKEKLARWIEEGAEYELHWSLITPQMPVLPAVTNPKWVRNPIDAFVLAKLESRGLAPAAEADLATLIRRVSLDLTGLPPTSDEVQAVLNDPSPNRYENYVDKLLAKPQWGEHRGRYWLDYARYADTHGIHFDNYREIWAYRDWVIDAFNRNQPFDSFSIEQLAGDLLPNPTLDQLVATGFGRCNITTNEGGAIDEEYLVLYTRDRVETTSLVWLGMTAGCGVCHDHKYDPLPQKEFYQLAAFFNNTVQNAMDGNIKDTPPIVVVPVRSDRSRYSELKAKLSEIEQLQTSLRAGAKAEFDVWLAKPDTARDILWTRRPAASKLLMQFPLNDHREASISALVDGQVANVLAPSPAEWKPGIVSEFAWQVPSGPKPELPSSGDFERNQPFSVSAWIKPSNPNQTGAVIARMDEENDYRGWDLWLQDGRVGTHLIHQWPPNALKVVARPKLDPDRWHHVAMVYDGSSKPSGIKLYYDGQLVPHDIERDSLTDTIRTDKPLKLGSRHQSASADGLLIQELRIDGEAVSADYVMQLRDWQRNSYLISKAAGQRSDDETQELFDWWLRSNHVAFRDLVSQRGATNSELQQIEQRGTRAHIVNERPDAPVAYVLNRGEYTQRRDQVTPATPSILPPMPPELPRNRLGFAQWLFRPEHPLTSRVTVNRFWQEVFGQGLVSSSGDFGVAGQLPSHPELLDYLAVSFREGGWDVKRLFRQIVTSSTYRQSAVVTPEKLIADPANVLLSRGARYRLDAEVLRDYALAASGLLDTTIGGPSVRPYQPPGVWEAVAMPESNTRSYKEDEGTAVWRRSLYTFWKRAAPPASMDILNAPNRETCAVRRDRTNTPIQALVTLNDPQFVEAARYLAQRILKSTATSDNKSDDFLINQLGVILLARSFSAEELEVIRDSLKQLREHFAENLDSAKSLVAVGRAPVDAEIPVEELASWSMLCNQLMNLDEVLNK